MSNGSIIDISSGAAQSIGRYFSVISVVPSSLYVIFVYALVTSGSWQHSPNWSHSFKSLEQLGLGGFTLLAFLSITLGVIIHPAQFALVQFFEGYWGNTRIAQAVRAQRILHYQQFCAKLNNKKRQAENQRSQLRKSGVAAPSSRVRPLSVFSEANRVRDNFPRSFDDIMPTRLGNVLRRTESQAGSQYGLNALVAVPHILMVAPADHVEYVNDQRSQLDLAVRMTFMSALASATAMLFLWHCRFWVFIAIIPYVLAYLSYRGSVVAAGHYGSALDTLINLDRFALYQQLHLELPGGTTEERKTNKKLGRLFNYDDKADIDYQHAISDED